MGQSFKTFQRGVPNSPPARRPLAQQAPWPLNLKDQITRTMALLRCRAITMLRGILASEDPFYSPAQGLQKIPCMAQDIPCHAAHTIQGIMSLEFKRATPTAGQATVARTTPGVLHLQIYHSGREEVRILLLRTELQPTLHQCTPQGINKIRFCRGLELPRSPTTVSKYAEIYFQIQNPPIPDSEHAMGGVSSSRDKSSQ